MIVFRAISTWDPEFVAAIRRHYTESRGAPPGKKIAWRIEEDGVVVGWIGLGEPAFKLAPRRRLGLADARPMSRTVSCFIYRLEGPRVARASEILKQWHEVAGRAWMLRYGWRPEHWETMCGREGGDGYNLGACFKRAGWRSLGWTTGRSARRPEGHGHRDRVWGDSTRKLVLYRGPLARMPEESSVR